MQADCVLPWFLGEKRCLGAFKTDNRSDVLGHLEELGWYAWLKSWFCLKMLKIPNEALLDFSDLGSAFSLSLSFSPLPPVTWAPVILSVTDSMVVFPTGDPPRISQLSPKALIIPPSTHQSTHWIPGAAEIDGDTRWQSWRQYQIYDVKGGHEIASKGFMGIQRKDKGVKQSWQKSTSSEKTYSPHSLGQRPTIEERQ